MLFTRKKADNITPSDAADGVRTGEIVLVDVREPGEREKIRPAGSRHIPLAELPGRLGELPRDRPVAFICRSGSRSAAATQVATKAGMTALNVSGGMEAWKKAGSETESGAEGTS